MVKKKNLWKKRLPELINKGLIDVAQMKTLMEMIDSPDRENFVMMQELVKTFIGDTLSRGLNKGQKIAFHGIIDFLANPQYDALVLKGYAGTGKTFLVKRVLEYVTQTENLSKIAITAPTNKAVNVLFKASIANSKGLNPYIFEDLFDRSARLTYSTIHKLLAMRPVNNNATGEMSFEVDPKNPSNISDFKYLVVDECSMLVNALCHDLMKHSATTRIIFMGDPCQIPPVKQGDAIPFSKNPPYNFLTLELTEIMRQKSDNPIIGASFEVRDNINELTPIPVIKTEINERGHGITYLNNNHREDKDKIMPLLKERFDSKEFLENPDYMKVIAYRNKTIDYMNNVIRQLLYGQEALHYVVGEKLIVQKSIFKKGDKYWKIILTTSEELEVKSVKHLPFHYFQGMVNLAGTVYELEVTSYDLLKDRDVDNTIRVLHPSHTEEYKKLIESCRQRALRTRNPHDWATFFDIQKWFADVSYNYAITAHKAQGSTYKNVLFLEDDIDMATKPSILEKNRIKYTSYSRASELLYILKRQ